MYILRSDIEEAAQDAPFGYREGFYAARDPAKDQPDKIHVPAERRAVIRQFKADPASVDIQAMMKEWAKQPGGIYPVPRDEWPAWAKWVGKYESPEDQGIGDTVERMLGKGGLIFKASFEALHISCGCDRRREDWNAKYAYRPA